MKGLSSPQEAMEASNHLDDSIGSGLRKGPFLTLAGLLLVATGGCCSGLEHRPWEETAELWFSQGRDSSGESSEQPLKLTFLPRAASHADRVRVGPEVGGAWLPYCWESTWRENGS